MSEQKFDPEKVPVRFAATVMLIDDRPDLQVFMMKRNANTAFAGGMWVFPGGSVDEGDAAEKYATYCTHRTDSEACEMLELTSGGLAFYVAAIREAFEEAGILLALNKSDESQLKLLEPEIISRFDAYRDGVNDGSQDFLAILDQENLILDAAQMHYVARWITPLGPPRRFDTRFFIARMPESQNPVHDDNELIHSVWMSPAEILEGARDKTIGLMPPTMRMIECLAEFNSAADVIAAAEANLPYERIPMNGKGPAPESVQAEPGWVKLRPLKNA
ncbi:MAG: NUDIX hydrolase [Pseudomonadales bacterium]|nr:NUDIX hydrolase [Pseudomonadales bacterium]